MIGQLLRPVRAGEKHLAGNDPAIRAVPDTLTLSSPAFQPGGTIPARYAGRGVGETFRPP